MEYRVYDQTTGRKELSARSCFLSCGYFAFFVAGLKACEVIDPNGVGLAGVGTAVGGATSSQAVRDKVRMNSRMINRFWIMGVRSNASDVLLSVGL